MSTSRRVIGLLVAVALLFLVYVFGHGEKSNSSEFASLSPIPAEVQETQATTPPPAEIATADVRSALSDACSRGAFDPADREWTQEEIQTQIDALNEQKRTLSENLSASSSAEHLHLAALLEDDPASRFELLHAAISRSPSDPFLVWSAVQICSEAIETMRCPLRDWERLLIAVDGQNSESWVRVAANRYAANEHDAALEAIRYASTAAESRAYWTEMIEMMERGFAAVSDYAFPERANLAVGFAASQLPNYGDYVRMCEESSARSVDWGQACLAYGQLVENQGKTELGVSVALSIQRLALEGLGEVKKAAAVQRRIEARREERWDWSKDHNPAIDRLVFSKPTLFFAYLAAIRSEGEVAARRQIAVEIERLIEQQPELACKQVIVR